MKFQTSKNETPFPPAQGPSAPPPLLPQNKSKGKSSFLRSGLSLGEEGQRSRCGKPGLTVRAARFCDR